MSKDVTIAQAKVIGHKAKDGGYVTQDCIVSPINTPKSLHLVLIKQLSRTLQSTNHNIEPCTEGHMHQNIATFSLYM